MEIEGLRQLRKGGGVGGGGALKYNENQELNTSSCFEKIWNEVHLIGEQTLSVLKHYIFYGLTYRYTSATGMCYSLNEAARELNRSWGDRPPPQNFGERLSMIYD
ncbi:unnamed protein product [Parnassius apollo]|uniref:(apollo) hypothetical protein n=1 Tax=Parnassius apollo TaxID=110799 RepID=A0A8S3XXG1_PARAO|nr:unnamed protein product [Parnassius apollo]